MRDFSGRLLLEGVRAGLSYVFSQKWRKLGLSINRPDKSDGLYSPYAILGLAPWEIEYPRDWPKQFHMVGPVNWSDSTQIDAEDLIFLESPQPKVLVTMGTHLESEKSDLLPKMAKALAPLPYHFLFTLGGSEHLSVRKISSANIRFTSYVPYSEVLKHVDAVVHHGGSGIMYSCLAAGLPALVIPQGFDQFDNAQRVAELGAGIRLDARRVTNSRLRQSLEKIIDNPTYKAQTNRLAEIITQNYSPVENAVSIIEQVGSTQKPVYRQG